MKQKKPKLTKKQQRRERRFMRKSVIVSTLLMAVLAFFAGRYYRNREAILTEKARIAMEQGDFEEAQALLGKVVEPASEGSSDGSGTEAQSMLNESRYQSALKLLEEGKYEEAREAFTTLGDYADSREKISECRYRAAEALEQAGRYEEAADAFFALAGYGDALSRCDGCRFMQAGELENAGELDAAFTMYRSLGNYPGADERAVSIAMKITGASDPELAVQLAQGYSPEQIAVIERLFTARASLPLDAVAVGFYHTAGLTDAGTVVCCGRNTEGQCDTGAWTGITAVKAGAYHTVGLKNNGTVVCCGRNTEGQCDTGAWTNIIAVACTDYGTAGLGSDGSVLYCGFGGSGVSGWKDVKALGAGSYITVGIRSGGTLLSTHPCAAGPDWTGLVAADANTGYAIALTQDGRVLFTGSDNGWSDCVSLSAGSTGYAAVSAEGKIYAAWFEERNAIDLSDITDAAAVAVGGTHTAVLLKDGRVICRGSNEYGECDAGSFKLMKAKSAQ